MGLRRAYSCIAVFSVLFARAQEPLEIKAFRSYPVTYGMARKDPGSVKRLQIKNYTDTVFPNDTILLFKNIESLTVHGGRIRSVTGDTLKAPVMRVDSVKLKQLTHLQKLKLDGFDFSCGFPEAICTLSQLKELIMSVCGIRSLPPSFGRLSELSSFECRVNELTELPDEFIQLRNLEALDMGNNNFRLLPQVIADLPALRTLNLANIEAFVFTPATPKVPFDLYVNQVEFMACYATVKRILSTEHMKRFEADIGICSDYLPFLYRLGKDDLANKMLLGEKGCRK